MAANLDFLDEFDEPLSESTALKLDQLPKNASLRHEFNIPTIAQLQVADVAANVDHGDSKQSTYLCGNSLGVQPRRTRTYMDRYLATWATQGVHGHFKAVAHAATAPWLHLDEQASAAMAGIVGARAPGEVAVMQTLTANLHLLLASFYAPTPQRFKVLIEGKAFPSDHFAVQSHVAQRGYDAAQAVVLLAPSDVQRHLFATEHILQTIDQHADELALILLPGIQFYTGQLLDIKTITAHAHSKGILIGWDLAHAAGNVVLQLHDWDVDFAAWCTYKYLNSGPGCIGALFVHEKHGHAPEPASSSISSSTTTTTDHTTAQARIRPSLTGWWGSSKASRFDMTNQYAGLLGAAGWQLSNPSALDMTSLLASLAVFGETSMPALRARSLRLTAYLEYLLLHWPAGSRRAGTRAGSSAAAADDDNESAQRPYVLLTPADPEQRGAQISVRFSPGLLDGVMADLEAAGVVIDERKPDVIRIAPAPLYNTFEDVWHCVSILWQSLDSREW